MTSIKEKKELAPLSPLPATLSSARVQSQAESHSEPQHQEQGQTSPPEPITVTHTEDTTPQPSSPPPTHCIVPDSSTSTVATVISEDSSMSPPVGSDTSASTDMSPHSVVRGFTIGRVSSAIRSQTHMAPQPTPFLKTSNNANFGGKKKGAQFTLGGSSDEGGESSLETHYMSQQRSSLSDGIKKAGLNRKTASFKDDISTKIIPGPSKAYESEVVFESDSEDDEVDESAIEDDDDEDQWEDSDSDSAPASVHEQQPMFQRVDSRPNLTSRRSLLTSLMHEGDRAAAIQNAASRSTPALRRSRTTSPNGPSLATSPEEDEPLEIRGTQIPLAKLTILTTSNNHQPALSPRTTRRNMLSTELSESLRKHLLWERQQKNVTNNAAAALKRRHTSNDVKNLKHYPGEGKAMASGLPSLRENTQNNSWSVFEHGLQEYHQTGW